MTTAARSSIFKLVSILEMVLKIFHYHDAQYSMAFSMHIPYIAEISHEPPMPSARLFETNFHTQLWKKVQYACSVTC